MSFTKLAFTIEGLQHAQSRNQRRIALLQPPNLPGRVAQYIAIALQAYAIDITPVDTGAWKNSHLILDHFARGRAEVYVNPYAVNPRSRGETSVSEYAGVYEQEGGDYAVYQRTLREAGGRVTRAALEMARQAVRNA